MNEGGTNTNESVVIETSTCFATRMTRNVWQY